MAGAVLQMMNSWVTLAVIVVSFSAQSATAADMSIADFWSTVEAAKGKDGDKGHARRLEARLVKLTPAEIEAFHLRFEKFEEEANTGAIWVAATLLNGRDCSDDCFLYFRRWLISLGRRHYSNALKNPDSLADLGSTTRRQGVQFEQFGYAAVKAYEVRTGKDLYELVSKKSKQSAAGRPDWDWQEYSPAVMQQIAPRLWASFGAEVLNNRKSLDKLAQSMIAEAVIVEGVGEVRRGSTLTHSEFGDGTVQFIMPGSPPTARVQFKDREESVALHRTWVRLKNKP